MADNGIALNREREAREFIDRLISQGKLDRELFGDHRNFKPWYSHRSLYQEGIARVYVGIDPGGDPMFPDNTTGPQYQTFLEGDDYNAFLDESWTGSVAGEAPLQNRTRRVFRELYGESVADDLLRQTACFNVCPLRTGESTKIHKILPDLWRECVEWFSSVINDLMPTTIICNSSAKNGSSPWAALNVTQDWYKRVNKNAYLRSGWIELTSTRKARVIGLPHLTNRWLTEEDRERLYGLISANRCRLVGHEKD